MPRSTGSVFETRSQASATTVSSVPVNMMFWIPVAKFLGQDSQRMTSCAVLAAMKREHKVCELTGKEATDEM